ncbi:MAG: hypothetical protein SGI73_04050 [Chloroflexota bacterium]|nr:hypothetical protein [Chloroflexota bacterium]
MFNRRGELSIFRIGLIIGLIGIVAIGGGVVAFFADQASRQVPLDIAVYPGAEPWGQADVRGSSRKLLFRVAQIDPEQVTQYYEQKMGEFYGNDEFNCVRNPASGVARAERGVTNPIPFQFACMFDRSGFNTTQFTRVIVYPGQPNADPTLNAEGSTVIVYEQIWQPA